MSEAPTTGPTVGVAMDRIRAARLVAVVRSTAPAPTALALVRAGVEVLEVSLTCPGALDAVHAVRSAAPDALVGAGTVLTVADARNAWAAGAQFLMAPDLNLDVLAWAGEHEVLHLPGVLTPTEMTTARAAGAVALKLFPASAFGPAYVRELLAPLPDLALVPTGGVRAGDVAAYLDAGAVAVGVGSALVPTGAGADEVTDHARRLLARLRPTAPLVCEERR